MRRRPPDLDDLDREIRDHLEAETLDNIARGMSQQEARRAALRKFGNVVRVKEDVREVWLRIWWDQCQQDARDALRRLRRNPGLAVAIAGTVALGISLTTTVFSVVNAVVLRPLSYPHPERMVWFTARGERSNDDIMNGLDFADWNEQATTFEHMVAFTFADATVHGGGEAARWRVMAASDGFWEMTGAQPLLGTLPSAHARDVLVLSHRTFRDRFHSDPQVIGRTVMLGGQQATIGAVLPADFAPQLPEWRWRPDVDRVEIDAFRGLVTPTPVRDRRETQMVPIYLAFGELKEGVSIDQARAELETIHDRVQRTVQDVSGRVPSSSVVIMPLHEKLIGAARFPLQVLLAAAVCVLLITCANVGNLLLSRASARQKEIALRMSVGGGPLRVVRLLLAESVAYAMVGGAVGLFCAWGLINIIIGLLGGAVPRLSETTLDLRVVAFVAALSLVTAILFGLGPALALSRTSVHDVLKSGVRSASSSPRMLLAGRVSVAVQLAMAIVLLAGAGLMAKSLWRMTSYPPGFEPDQILTMRVDFTGAAYREDTARFAYVDALLARARALPGVRDAAVTTDRAATMLVFKEGERPPEDREARAAAVSAVSPSFGPLLGMSLVRGRWLDDVDGRSTILINEALAHRDFPGIDPVGHRIQLPWVDSRGFGTIVGVVRNLKYARIDADAAPEVFTHYKGRRLFGVTLALRIDGDAIAAAPTVTQALAAIDPTQSLFAVKTVEQRLEDSIAPRQFNLLLLGTFAVVALILVALGIYGVVAYAVAERTHEVGIRMALGAERGALVALMVRQVMTGVAAGLIIGVPVAVLATRPLAELLYDVPPTDALTFVATTGMLGVIALVASVAPAMRAAFIDPVTALRAE